MKNIYIVNPEPLNPFFYAILHINIIVKKQPEKTRKKNASSFDIKRRNVLLRMTKRFGHEKFRPLEHRETTLKKFVFRLLLR